MALDKRQAAAWSRFARSTDDARELDRVERPSRALENGDVIQLDAPIPPDVRRVFKGFSSFGRALVRAPNRAKGVVPAAASSFRLCVTALMRRNANLAANDWMPQHVFGKKNVRVIGVSALEQLRRRDLLPKSWRKKVLVAWGDGVRKITSTGYVESALALVWSAQNAVWAWRLVSFSDLWTRHCAVVTVDESAVLPAAVAAPPLAHEEHESLTALNAAVALSSWKVVLSQTLPKATRGTIVAARSRQSTVVAAREAFFLGGKRRYLSAHGLESILRVRTEPRSWRSRVIVCMGEAYFTDDRSRTIVGHPAIRWDGKLKVWRWFVLENSARWGDEYVTIEVKT